MLVEVLGSVVADIRNVVGQFFQATLRLTYLERILVDMDGGEEVLADETFVQHDRIFIVVALPWHVSDLDITAKSKLTCLCRISFCQYITGLDTLPLEADRTQVDGCALVRLAELR